MRRVVLVGVVGLSPLLPACDRLVPAEAPANAPAARARAAAARAPVSGAAALRQASGRRPSAPDPYLTAWQRGVRFRASGIEPGWYVEVFGGERPTRLELVWDYASNRLDSRDVHRSDADGLLSFTAADDRFAVTVRAQRTPCADPGGGAAADYTVTVEVGAQTLRGCGRGR